MSDADGVGYITSNYFLTRGYLDRISLRAYPVIP